MPPRTHRQECLCYEGRQQDCLPYSCGAAVTERQVLAKLPRNAPGMVLGIGDDCAIYRPVAGEDLLFTTDQMIEHVHFTIDYPASELGRKALARSLSDIAAMGGTPRFCLVALALAPHVDDSWVSRFYRGLLDLADETGTPLAGGDLARGAQLACDVMVCGSVPTGRALLRSGARIGDRIYVSGELGGWTHKQLPNPRLDIGRKLLGKATACIDISDGLSLDLQRLCEASGVAAELESVPVLTGATLEQALHDGEDYELLYTVPPKIRVPGKRIGIIVDGQPGHVTFQGKPLPPLGYDHFRNRT